MNDSVAGEPLPANGGDAVTVLRTLAAEMLRGGFDLEAVLAAFDRTRCRLRDAGREADEDAVLDVMDFIVGWCSPHVKL